VAMPGKYYESAFIKFQHELPQISINNPIKHNKLQKIINFLDSHQSFNIILRKRFHIKTGRPHEG
jgi:hypothetical protein